MNADIHHFHQRTQVSNSQSVDDTWLNSSELSASKLGLSVNALRDSSLAIQLHHFVSESRMLYTVPAMFKYMSSQLYTLFCLLSSTVSSPDESSPNVDLLSYVFENQTDDQEKPVRFVTGLIRYGTSLTLQDIDRFSNTLRFITSGSAHSTVRRLIAGLKAEGLRPGDCVCLHSFNDVSRFKALLNQLVSDRSTIHCFI